MFIQSNSSNIRKKFLEYFEEKGHRIIPSAPMVIKDDPTLMFTNAGMNQFKDIFLGNAQVKYKRVVNTQKCLRVSGKHNDLEQVGVDTYHHTMFEMLGNWSFGDYFKKEAIEWAWELLTDVYGIPVDRLYVTVLEEDKESKLKFDKESFDIWKKLIDEDRIIMGSKKDNFWEMGEAGPCGPCSEIHIDMRDDKEREKADGGALINKDHPEVIELWNLVFIEFNRLANGELKPLPNKHVDTGLGFERLCMVLQGKKSNYDTDVFEPLIKEIEKISSKKHEENDNNIAIRVIADHTRAVAFAIADGQLPYRDGAGYVIRRILRRAIRYGYSFLGLKEPFIYQLVSVLVNQIGEQFPEIKAQKEFIQKVIREEEEGFLRTLEKGMLRFEKELARLQPSKFGAGMIPYFEGLAAFELYDTYGFPVDLTNLIAREHGYKGVDMDYYNRCLAEQKSRSRHAATIDTEDWLELQEISEPEFIGYNSLETEVEIVKYRKIKAKGKEQYQLVFNKTPFYSESGGQIGDTGYIERDGEKTYIKDTQKESGLIVHITDKLPSKIKAPSPDGEGDLGGEVFHAVVNKEKRIATANNHSATHLMHAALKQVLGDHIEQKGSLVDSRHLRFDFSHFSKLTDEEIAKIEKIVNEKIRENIPLDVKHLPLEQAKKMGATALFGEKYGDIVRVVTFDKTLPVEKGVPARKDSPSPSGRGAGGGVAFSIELCGGTHVEKTGEIGLFKITGESAIAAGIRRIEAITSEAARIKHEEQLGKVRKLHNALNEFKELVKPIQDLLDNDDELSDGSVLSVRIGKIGEVISKIAELKIQEQLKGSKELPSVLDDPLDIAKPIQDFIEQNNKLNKRLEKLRKAGSNIIKGQLLDKIQEINGIKCIIEKVDLDMASVKEVAFQLKKQIDDLFLVLGTATGEKANLTILISDNLINEKKLNASDIIREIAKDIQGGGGGQPFFATAGGKDVSGLEKALERAKLFVTSN
ncbi:MAG: alanine--tRNA ligase [Bacteroidota bacterium]